MSCLTTKCLIDPLITIEPSLLPAIRERIEAYITGQHDLTGIEFYYLLEQATPLREFHFMVRRGPKNQSRSGLQQSYGDHNRLLLFGLDQLIASDVAWCRSRLEHAGSVSEQRMVECLRRVEMLELTREERLALWIGAAMHDCGMLGQHASDVDVEDGVVLASHVIDALCPPALIPLAIFAVRNHDYIKQVFTGEVPAQFIRAQMDEFPDQLRYKATVALGMVQVAGAASLGEGRLTPFRMAIFEACASGRALDLTPPAIRLAALLGTGEEGEGSVPIDVASGLLTGLHPTTYTEFQAFLEQALVHQWHKLVRSSPDSTIKTRWCLLREISKVWVERRVNHLVVTSSAIDDCRDRPLRIVEEQQLLNGTKALVLG